MRSTILLIAIGLSLAVPGYCDQPTGNTSQLMQLNRASQQQLRNIQDSSARADDAQRNAGSDRLDRQQDVEQQKLQERQRRELLMLNQRAKTAPDTGLPHRLQAIDQQQQFRLQQQNQLNRFRIQQDIRRRY